jgi:ribosomal 50S subunit-recycling heat shock protein
MSMRLDLFLKKTHLLKRRELARELCDSGSVRLNGVPKKASAEVRIGDELLFPVFNRVLRVKVLALPEGSAAKSDQWSFVEILEERRVPFDEGILDDPFQPRPKPPTNH